jgi:hypothetical protein
MPKGSVFGGCGIHRPGCTNKMKGQRERETWGLYEINVYFMRFSRRRRLYSYIPATSKTYTLFLRNTQSVWRMKGAVLFFFLLLFKRLYLPVEFMPTTDESRIIYERAAPLPLQGRMEPSSVFVEPIDICSLILSDRRHVVGWSVLAGLMDPVVPLWRKKKKKTLEDWNLQSFNCCGRAGTESTRWRVDEFVSSLIAFLHWISEQTWNKRHHKNHLQRLYGTNPACLTALARLTLFLFFYSHQSEPYKIKSCERWETERTCNELRMV